MSNYILGAYGIANYLIQQRRHISSQNLINTNDNTIITPKSEICIETHQEFQTEDKKFKIGIVSSGKYYFHGIGSTNKKCMIKTKEDKILLYSKGKSKKSYDIRLIAPNLKKIKFISKHGLVLVLCYWNYSINTITNVISDYFKNDKIEKIINLTENLDENWNDILSINIDNSISNNNFDNPVIEIVFDNKKKDISEIATKYNFEIIYKFFLKNNNNKVKDIIDDANLISIISQDHYTIDFKNEDLLVWILDYLEIFTTDNGKFFKYFDKINEKDDFIKFVVSHKIASLYLKVNSRDEILLANQLNKILNSDDSSYNFIKESIIEYGLVSQSNIDPRLNNQYYSNEYYYDNSNYYYHNCY